jgi:2-dehydropantoate 2-reductase
MDKVAIVGAGAMGCLFAARLAEAGAQVTLLDVDRPRLDAITNAGVTIDDDFGVRTVPVAAMTAAEMRSPPDLLLLFTKGTNSAAAVRSISHLIGADTYALTLQNGIGNAEILAGAFPPERVLLGVTTVPSNLDGATRISSHGSGHVVLGPLRPEGEPGAEGAAQFLRRAKLEVRIDPAVEVAVWEKVAFNAALNPLGAVTELTNGELGNPDGRRIARAVVAETVATAAAKGIMLDEARVLQQIDHALANHKNHRSSMLQDRRAGRRTEIESINGAIVREGERFGVATPVTGALAALMRLIDRGAV